MVGKRWWISKKGWEWVIREESIEVEGCESSIVEVKGREGFRKEVVNRVKCYRDFI